MQSFQHCRRWASLKTHNALFPMFIIYLKYSSIQLPDLIKLGTIPLHFVEFSKCAHLFFTVCHQYFCFVLETTYQFQRIFRNVPNCPPPEFGTLCYNFSLQLQRGAWLSQAWIVRHLLTNCSPPKLQLYWVSQTQKLPFSSSIKTTVLTCERSSCNGWIGWSGWQLQWLRPLKGRHLGTWGWRRYVT